MAANPAAVRVDTVPAPRSGLAIDPAAPGLREPARTSPAQRLRALLSPAVAFAAGAAALIIGWYGRDERRLFADEGLGYALGILGLLMMLTLLVYPLRKRVRWLRFIGPVRNWFKVHMTMGALATLTILYHCNFSLGSLNSSLALMSMLLVAASGLIGRFLYAKIHHGLFGRKKDLKELLAGVRLSAAETGGVAHFVPGLMKEVAAFDRQVLTPPKGILESMVLPLKLMFATRRGYRHIMDLVSLHLQFEATRSSAVRAHRKRMEKACRRYLKRHLKQVRRVAAFAAYERLFSLWHKVHLPFFALLVISAIVHVVAVHFYAA